MTLFQNPGLFKVLPVFALLLAGFLSLCGCGGSKDTSVSSNSSESSPPKPSTEAPKSEFISVPFDIAIQAALNGHLDTIKQALETGTDPNQIDEAGRTLLMVASFNGHTETVKTLLDRGAKPDTQDMAGRTALMYAATDKNLPTVKLLLENKAKVDLVDAEEHWTALMFAAAEGNLQVVQLLLEYKADTGYQDIDGSTAESFARDNGHIEVADFLKNWNRK